MRFKVGDKVKVINAISVYKRYIGKTGVITRLEKTNFTCDDGYILTFDDRESRCIWEDHELELVESKPFTKSDLKDGMIVEYRNGHKRLYINGIFTAYDWGWISLDDFNDDLTYPTSEFYGDTLDVVKVYKTNARLLKDMLNDPSRLELIWERVETKKSRTPMTVEDIENDIKKRFKESEWLMNRFKKGYQPVWIALDEINTWDE